MTIGSLSGGQWWNRKCKKKTACKKLFACVQGELLASHCIFAFFFLSLQMQWRDCQAIVLGNPRQVIPLHNKNIITTCKTIHRMHNSNEICILYTKIKWNKWMLCGKQETTEAVRSCMRGCIRVCVCHNNAGIFVCANICFSLIKLYDDSKMYCAI